MDDAVDDGFAVFHKATENVDRRGFDALVDELGDSFTETLRILDADGDFIVGDTEKESPSQRIGKRRHDLEPTLGLFDFQHLFEVIIGAFRNQLIQQLLVPLKFFHVVEDDAVFFAIHIKLAARHGLRFPIAFLPPRNGRRGNAEFLRQCLLAERQPHSRISNFFTKSHRFTFYKHFLS